MMAVAMILDCLAQRRRLMLPTMIAVAHPDDETIGIGAQLCRFCDALLVHATDGTPRDGHDAAAHGFATLADYADARRRELADALAAGGAAGIRREVLGIADQQACRSLLALTRRIAGLLQREHPAAILTHAYEGGHPDHDAVCFAVHAACRSLALAAPPAIIEMALYHACGGEFATGVFLPAATPVTTLPLTAAERARKSRMLDCFRSQRAVLAPFDRAVERVRPAPDYDFTRPPHDGALHYERLGWGITGADWRRAAVACLDALGWRWAA